MYFGGDRKSAVTENKCAQFWLYTKSQLPCGSLLFMNGIESSSWAGVKGESRILPLFHVFINSRFRSWRTNLRVGVSR